jgi:hypothetical protein
MSDQNSRKFPRANYPCFLTIWQGHNYGTIMANTANIGAGGLLVYLSEGLMIGAKVEIKIDFNKEDSFRCTGIVLRCQRNREDPDERRSPYSVAIVFENLDEAKSTFLKDFINKQLTENTD